MSISFLRTIPILRIFNVDKAKEFYCDFLGFIIDWEHRSDDKAPIYMQISRDELVLHLSEHHGDATPGSTVFVWMTKVDDFNRELLGKNYKYQQPGIEDTEFGARMMTVLGPFHNQIRFAQEISRTPTQILG